MDLFAFDDDYVRRLRERDPDTQRHFVSYFTALLGIKLRGKLTHEALEDVRQEVFARVLNAIYRGDLRDGSRLGPYVNTVCNNIVFEGFRKDARTEPLDETVELAGESDSERLAIEHETTERVRKVLAELKPRDAAILRDLFLRDIDKDEVCRLHRVDRAYLRVLLHRAKQHFRQHFDH